MSRTSEHDVSPTTGIVLLALFLALVGVGVVTVVLPELRNEPADSGADAGVESP